MKLICPGCSLKGTADESLRDQNVRCPGCRSVFKLNENVIVGSPRGLGNAVGDPVSVPQDRIGVCESCGFRYSRANLSDIDSRLYCKVCAPDGFQTGAAF